MKKLPPKLSVDVDVDLPIEAYIPQDYVPDMRQKIDIYRRMARMEDISNLDEMRDELRDRFGEPPAVVERMLEIAELRFDAAIWQISEIKIDGEYLVFEYTDPHRISQLKRQSKHSVRIANDHQAYVPALNDRKVVSNASNLDDVDWLPLARSVLHLA